MDRTLHGFRVRGVDMIVWSAVAWVIASGQRLQGPSEIGANPLRPMLADGTG